MKNNQKIQISNSETHNSNTLSKNHSSIRKSNNSTGFQKWRNNYSVNEKDLKMFMKNQKLLNVKNIFKITLVSEFHGDERFLEIIDHSHSTRRKTEGRFKVPLYKNDYGKHSLEVQLPIALNLMPKDIIDIKNNFQGKNQIKTFLPNLQ